LANGLIRGLTLGTKIRQLKKVVFSRLRLKLATFYASMISLERIGETAVTNAQLTNGELVITVYGWDKVSKIFEEFFHNLILHFSASTVSK
jgi:hypothetical protein